MPAHSRAYFWRFAAAIAPAIAVAASSAACNLHFGNGVEAKESWTRTYTVKPGATLVVRESNGRIRVEVADGDKIEVVATRISTAPTEEAAKADLKNSSITENVTADLVELDSSTRSLQIMMNQSRRVEYEIKVPKMLNVTLKTANGAIDVRGVGGTLAVEATNGKVEASALAGAADVSAVNGQIKLEFAKIHDAGVRCKTTNGQIVVTVPAAAKANITARVLHGVISTENLSSLEKSEDSRQRLSATIGGGGPGIRLETTNGEVRVVGR